MFFPKSVFLMTTAVLLVPCAQCDDSAQSLINSIQIFNYVTCKGRKVNSGVMGNFTATSRLNCVRECTSQPSCRSCTFCQVGASKTCALSTDHQPSCPALTLSDGQCSVAELMVDVCKNGGQFNKMTMECDCLENWEGNVCEKSRFTFPAVTTPAPPQTGTAQYSQTTKKDCKFPLCGAVGDVLDGLGGIIGG